MMEHPGDPSRISATLILAAHAEAENGKLHVMGAFWTQLPPIPIPTAVCGSIQVPWALTNQTMQVSISLVDEDGQPVLTPVDPRSPIGINFPLEAGRAAGLRAGAVQEFPFAINSGPLPVLPGHSYSWRLLVDDEVLATRTFRVADKVTSSS